MEFYNNYKNRLSENVGCDDFYKLLSQCGMQAVQMLDALIRFDCRTDIYGNPFWDLSDLGMLRMLIEDKNVLLRIIKQDKMYCSDIVDVMKFKCPSYSPDFKYTFTTRDVKGKVFELPFYGIVAMKFEKTEELHWAAMGRGKIYTQSGSSCGYKNIKGIKEKYPGFDGFGHLIVFWAEAEMRFLRDNETCLQKECEICGRKNWCHSN